MNNNKIFTLLIAFFYTIASAFAQIEVTDATVAPFTPENLITNYFLGEGVQVLSVKYEGTAEAIGYFNNAQSRIGINRGIVMTNGYAVNRGSFSTTQFGIDSPGKSTANNNNKSDIKDKDVDAIIKTFGGSNIVSQNLAKYTIKFIPSADTLRFRYVFGSEEYPEYICASFNDIFGFFISGPGINGPYENNGENIALIPGTNLPVAINNINLGKGTTACPPRFPQYYNNNNNSDTEPVYDGILKTFTAQAVVQPCKEYTIKLIIADVGDANYDSGVFLEAKSFGTGSIKVDRISAASDNNIVEGCEPGSIVFRLPKKADKDTPLKCNVIGSAINGVDYKLIATNLFIPKGDSVLKVKIDAINDGLFEGNETIGFDIQRDICNRDTFWFNIKDNNLKAIQRKTINDSTICIGQSINFDATISLAPPPSPFFQSNDSTVINTLVSGGSVKPSILPILVTNVTPLQFSPSMIESVCVNLKHSWVDDIDLYLVAPNGQFIALSTDNGGDGNNMTNTCFTPTAIDKIEDGIAPFTGNWLPEENFSELLSNSNNPSNGEWKLMVVDDSPSIDGKILNWNITFKSNYKLDYEWNTNQNISCTNCPKPIVTPKNSFNYVVKMEDVYGCELRDTAVVTVKDSLLAPSVLCGIQTHSSVNFSWLSIPDAKSYEISINGGAWQTNGTNLGFKVSSLSPNTPVTLNVRAVGSNCGAKTSTLVCRTLPCTTVTPNIDNLTQVTCRGKKDGAIKLSVSSGGTPPYTFTLGTNNNTNGQFSGLEPGKYKVSIEDVNGCPALANFEIIEPQTLSVTAIADSVSCPSAADAIALAEVKGGTMPYKYLWSSGATTELAKQLKPGKETVTITDNSGCTATASVNIYEPASPVIQSFSTPITCANKEDATLDVFVESGGTPPFSYLWDTGAGGLQPTQKIIGLKAGIYFLSITDNRGCVTNSALVVDATKPITVTSTTANPICFGAKTGQIDLNVNGGYKPYRYVWNNKDTTASIKNIKAGNYIVTVTDRYKCESIQNFDIKNPDSMFVVKKITPILCHGENNAAIEITPSGGSNVYTYLWSNGAKSKDITNLKSGTYILTLSDTQNCNAIDSILVTSPDSLEIDGLVTNSDCSQNNSGAINVGIKGGLAPYDFKWIGPNNFSASVPNLIGLKSGIYTLTLTDGNGCQKKKQYEIKQPTAFTVGGVITDVKCNAESNGQIKLIINGGIEPYVFTWDNNENKEVLTDLKSGTYKVTVNDASKCMTTASFTVKQPDSLKLTVSKKDSLCSGFSGEAEVLVKGGTNPYTYEWITGAITKKESNLTKGQYDVTVTDKNECVAVQKVDIFIYDELKISLLELPPSCADGNDGKIEIQKITSGGIDLNLNNFTYKWSNKEITQNINNAKGSETYVVTVTNKQGCSAEEMIQNSNPEPVVINLKKALNPSCAKGDDGSIECEGKGGTTPYDFTWENGTILSQITNLKEGSYNVSMSDAKGCRTTASYNLTQPKSFTINTLSSSEKCVGNANGSAEVQTKDGSAPFKYLWNNGKSTAKIENIAAGNYTVTVTDAVGCVQYGAVKVDAVAALIATISTSPVSCGGTADGTFTVQPKGGTPPYLYSVNGGAYNGQYKRIGLRPNFYEVLVKDANDCIVEIATTVTEPNKIEIDLGKDTILKFGDSYRIPTEIKNLVSSNPKYDWFPDNPQHISCTDCRNPIVSPRISTLYTLTVKDSLGCKASKSVNIIIKVSTNIAVPTGFSPNGDGENDLLLVHGDEGATVLKFNVFDRWGNLLFEKENFNVNDKNTGWNGFFREESMPSGTYIWTLSVQFKNESVEYFKGSTQLIR